MVFKIHKQTDRQTDTLIAIRRTLRGDKVTQNADGDGRSHSRWYRIDVSRSFVDLTLMESYSICCLHYIQPAFSAFDTVG